MKLLLRLLAFLPVLADVSAGDTMKASEFRVRDPYVVPCPEDGLYHLFISDEWSGGVGVSVRTSSDLRTWSKPRKVLTIPESWKIVNTWAPEVHRFKDKWYIFVTLGRRREDLPPMKLMTEDADFLKRFGPESFARRRRLGTYVFRSDELDGPYEPVSEESLTPVERMALDGTLWVEDGKPYMMFSWDWPQLGIGECALAPLKDDLSAFAAEPKTLFKASIVATNAWKANVDGPFLHRSEKSGKLFAIWSTTGVGSDFERGRPIFDGMKDGAYSVILCESASGRIGGPWINHRVIYSRNGGHGMFFKTFDGRLVLAIHQPEKWFSERAAFFSVEDRGDSLEIGGIFEPGFSKRSFVVPPSECSPGYFWMWNAKLDAGVIRSQLDEMYSNGLRSVCIHPFPKGFRSHRHRSEMSPDYLTDGFMEAYKAAIDHAEKLGMSAWLYDEGGWPSGGACGQVARQDTEGRFRQRFIREGPGPEMIAKEYAPGQDNVPSLVEKGATEKFIELTHERYAKTLGGHLGKTVRFAFTDEPDHPHDRHMAGWAVDFADEFKRRKGYDIMPFMAELLARRYETVSERLTRVRIDYHEVMGDLFVERFLLPVRRWCHEHGILSAGHFNGEDVPEFSGSYGHGALLKSLRALDVPGVDVIWRQLFPASLVNTGRQKPFPRYAASAAHQNGGMQVLSESFGIYGDSMSPDEMKWLVDFQMVRGVNLFVFGYYAMSYAGQWMSLLEPHSGPVVPYWEFQRPFFDYIARTSAMLSQGRPDLDVAVLYDEKGFRAGGVYAEMAGERHYSVSRILDRMNCEFEFVDEGQIEQARIEGGRLVVGAMKYATVVLPSSRWMGEAARGKLADFRKAGGKVLGPDDLDGIRPSMRIKGPLHKELRVCKRRCGVETLYFIVNESHWAGDVTLVFDEPGEVVRCDTETGSYVATGATDGKLDWHFPRFGSAMFIVGAEADKVESAVDGVITNSIDSGWTVRGIVRHKVGKSDFEIVRCEEKPVSVELGDWRSVFGRHFSGKAEYQTSFVSDRAGRMTLDLGRVCWSCRVRLNGKEIGKKFFGPYRFVVDVEKGVNVLEITVANLLANALSDDETRDRIARDFPPLSSYDRRQRVFDGSNNESGLFGPVKITGNGRIGSIDVRDFGAVGDGLVMDTRAIQRAIDACPRGGTVGIPPGEYLSGALWLKSDMTLIVHRGATLQGSGSADDYPVWDWWFEGQPEPCYASLLNVPVAGVSNLVIRGEGVIDGNGMKLVVAEEQIGKKGKRGRVLGISNSRNVRVEGVTFRQSPSWCVHFIYCDDVVISNVTVRTKEDESGRKYRGVHNGDGIDIDSCRRVCVENCRIFSQDDCIAIKSGRNEFGRKTARPSEDICIRNCFFGSGFGVAVGSEMSGDVRRVVVHDCVFSNSFSLASIKTMRGRGGMVEDIRFENIRFANHDPKIKDTKWYRGGIYLDMFYAVDKPDNSHWMPRDEGTPNIRGVVFRNIAAETVVSSAIYAAGLPESCIEGLLFDRVRAKGRWGMLGANLRGVTMTDCEIGMEEGERYRLENVINLSITTK